MTLELTHPYEAKAFDHLTACDGFSEELVRTHLGLYEGYVKHTNKAMELLRGGSLDAYAAGEVRRRLVWEFNGMRLHEIHFGAMQPGGTDLPDGTLRQAIADEFGDFDTWMKHFRAVGSMRGIGWACLTRDPQTGNLFNVWINEHDAGALAGTQPVLLMDVFEHAFIRDFGTDKNAYMDAFFDNVDWQAVEARL